MCRTPKYNISEARTGNGSLSIPEGRSCTVCSLDSGAGGGYNEREGVEYNQRDDSDDEYDEVW